MSSRVYRKFIWAGVILAAIVVIGTVGYWFIGGRQYSFVDTFYMTVITITTIGFQEVIDLSGNPAGRIFTIFIAVSGIGIMAYIITNLTALIVEGELTKSFRRRRMEKIAASYGGHYIVCGLGRVGCYIASELHATDRPHVLVDISKGNIQKSLVSIEDEVFIEGDATDSETLLKAGIENAAGLFAVTEDDNQNLVVSLTAKQLNPRVRVVARCNDTKNFQRTKRAGADSVISPTAVGAMRMASEMVRPTAVSFLDVMLRDRDRNLRVEEFSVPESFAGQPLLALNLKKFTSSLLLAIKTGQDWVYNPPENHPIDRNSTLVVMTTPEERDELARFLKK